MTVDDLNGGAAASADTTDVAETTLASTTTETVATDAGSRRSAIEKAFAAVDAAEDGDGGDTGEERQPAATGERERNPDGTFKGKEQQQAADDGQQQADKQQEATVSRDVPARFSSDPDAKAGWATTPDAVKTAVNRTIREMEGGIERYRGDATIYNDIFKPYVDLALNSDQDPAELLNQYVTIDRALSQSFGAGISMIFERAGQDPRQWAQALLGQPVKEGERAAPAVDLAKDRTILELRQEIARLAQGVGGITQTITQERVGQTIAGFSSSLSDADRTLFAELDNEVAAILASDHEISLTDAFAQAKGAAQARYQRIFGTAGNGTRQPAPAQTRTPGTGGSDPRRGQLSVTGAPGAGNNAAGTKKVSPSPRAAIDNAFASLGLD